MKFFCEYCGYRIDAEKDAKCPNCGASYKKNKKFIEMEETKNKEESTAREFKEKMLNNTMKTMRFSRFFMFIPIIIFIGIFGLIIYSSIKTNDRFNSRSTINNDQIQIDLDDIKVDTNTNTNTEDVEEETAKVTVGLNEYGATSEYQAKVTGYENVTFWYKEPKEGYEFITFHLMVENLTDKRISHENVNCIVDGVAQTNDFTSGYSTIPVFIDSNLTVTGESTFEVPKNATSYDIRYGDYITIHIEK